MAGHGSLSPAGNEAVKTDTVCRFTMLCFGVPYYALFSVLVPAQRAKVINCDKTRSRHCQPGFRVLPVYDPCQADMTRNSAVR